MITREQLSQIRRLTLRTRLIVNDSLAGTYRSAFKGQGIVFEAVRPYEPGDDVRNIDWNVTARTGEPHVKHYIEERELTIMLMLDTSASADFGTVRRHKRDLAVEVCAALAFAAISNNDRVGLLMFGEEVELYLPPRKGLHQAMRIMGEVMNAPARQAGTNLSLSLRLMSQILRSRAIIFVISDFLAPPPAYRHNLIALSKRHDVIAAVIGDPRERDFPAAGLLLLTDAETGEQRWADTASRRWRDAFAAQNTARREALDEMLRRAHIDRLDLPVDGDYLRELTLLFRRRANRR